MTRAIAALLFLIVVPCLAQAAGTQTASEALVRYLEREGVTKVFGVPGEETLHIVDALRKSKKIQFVLSGNEQGASFMASGYARATGKMGVALSTLGPGATNLLTGTANAQSENLKLLVITGQGPVDRPVGYHQKLDLNRLFRPVTRLSVEAKNGASVVPLAKKLFTAAHKRPGPVHLSLPSDVAAQKVKVVAPTRAPLPRRPRPNSQTVGQAAKLLRGAKFPVIIAGDGVLQEHAGHNARGILAFAKAHKIPVIPSAIAKGMFPWSSPLVLPPLDAFAKGNGAQVLRKADVILSVGYHPTETFEPQNYNPKGKAKLIHLSTQKLPQKHRIVGMTPNVELTGGLIKGLAAVHRQLKGFVAPGAAASATTRCRQTQDAELKRYMGEKSRGAAKPQQIFGELRRALDAVVAKGGKTLVFGDVGLNKGMMNQWLPVRRSGEVMMPNGMSTMGCSLPSAVGAKLARPELKVVSVSGDGGLLMNLQELSTAARYRLPLVHVALIDRRLGLIENHQRRNALSPSGVDVSRLDVVSLARGMGAKGVMLSRASQLAPQIKKALKRNRPTLIGIPVDYSEAQAAADRMGQSKLAKPLPKPRRSRRQVVKRARLRLRR
jgi:acetolactate synthase I/II/III large subunit